MSAKNTDEFGRFRSVTVGFRMSPAESRKLNMLVQVTGCTKQDYLIHRALQQDIIVRSSPRLYMRLKNLMEEILSELERISQGSSVDADLLDIISQINITLKGLKEEEKQ